MSLLCLSLMLYGVVQGQVISPNPVFNGVMTDVSPEHEAVLDEHFSDYSVFTMDQDSLVSFMRNQTGVFEFELNVDGHQWEVQMEENIKFSQAKVYLKDGAKMTEVDLGDDAIRVYEGEVMGINGFSHVRFRSRGNEMYGTLYFEGVKYVMKPLSKYVTGAASDKIILSTEVFSPDWAMAGGGTDCGDPIIEVGIIVDYSTYDFFEGNAALAYQYATDLLNDAQAEIYWPAFRLIFIPTKLVVHESPSGINFNAGAVALGNQLNNYWINWFGCGFATEEEPFIDLIVMVHHELTQNSAAGDDILDQDDPAVPACWVGDGGDYQTLAHEIGHIFVGGHHSEDNQGHLDPDSCATNNCSGGGYVMCGGIGLGDCFHSSNKTTIQNTLNAGCDNVFAYNDYNGNTCSQCFIGVSLEVDYEDPLILGCDGHNEVEYTMTVCNNYCEPQVMDVIFEYEGPTITTGLDGFEDCYSNTPLGHPRWCLYDVSFEELECKEYVFSGTADYVTGSTGLENVFAKGFTSEGSEGVNGGADVLKILDPIEIDNVTDISGNISNLIGNGLPANSGPCYSGAEELLLRITDDLIIDQDYCFGNHSIIEVDPGAKITIQDGAKLYLIQTDLLACGEMWDGIEVEDGGNLYMHASSLSDAIAAVTALDGSALELYGNDFINNYRGIYVPPNSNGNEVAMYAVVGNSFLYKPYGGNFQGMFPPYDGTNPIAGIEVNDLLYAGINGYENTANDAGLNYFHNLNNGIIATNTTLSISGCRFENIWQKAVHVKGNASMTNLFSYTGGRETYGVDIRNCTSGIEVERMHADISEVSLYDVKKGISIKTLFNGLVDVKNSTLSKVRETGIKLSMIHLLEGNIEDNIIISDEEDDSVTGIELNGMPFVQSAGWNISNNALWMPGPHVGIKTTAGGNDLIGNNTISNLGNANPFGFIGLSVSGSNGVTMSCNEITGSGAEAPSNGKGLSHLGKGIYAANTPGVTVSCNTLDEVQVGVNFWMTSVGADLSGNTFNDHHQGLLLGRYFTNFSSGWANIGLQQHRGNQWPALGSGGSGSDLGAKHLSDISDVVLNSRLFVDQPANSSFLPSNENNAGAIWFQNFDDFETTYYCEDISNNTCPEGVGYQGFTDGGSSDFENKIATGTLQTEEFAENYAWLSERQLFNRVQKGQFAPEMGTSFSNFQNQNQQSDIGRFDQAKSDLSQLFELEAGDKVVYRDDLQAIKNTIANLVELNHLIQITSEGNDSLDYVNQKTASLVSLHSLQSAFYAKAQLNLDQVENRKNNLTSRIDNLSSDAIYKANEKTVNQIYLSFLGEDAGVLVDAQIASLLYIAEQCPLEGGNGVFEARSLLALSSDRYVFDDDIFCDHGGRRSDESLDRKVLNQVFSIFPNPTKDNIELSYQLKEAGAAEISIQTRMGQVVLNEEISGRQEGVRRFDLDMLPAGVYFCSVRQNGQLLYIEKFVVIK